ncbi:MAG: TetR/AcrR family transcriptional regulator [Promethearchaeota archaeon]
MIKLEEEASRIDPRVRRTKIKIMDALLSLMKNKDLGEITVKEIIKKGGISRQAFYNHFKSVEDVLKKVFLDIIEKIKPEIQEAMADSNKIKNPIFFIFKSFEPYRKELRPIFRGGIKPWTHSILVELLNFLLVDLGSEHYKDLPEFSARVWRQFMIGGFMNVFSDWVLSEGRDKHFEHLSTILFQISESSVSFLIEQEKKKESDSYEIEK